MARRFSPRTRLLAALAGAALGVAIVGGAIGLSLTGGYGLGYGLYQAFVVVTTLGYSDLPPPSTPAGRVVLVGTLLLGMVGLFGGALALITESVELVVTQRWSQAVTASGHYIVCGFGRIGCVIARELRDTGEQVVVVDHDRELIEEAREEGFDAVLGDALEDKTLEKASVRSAAGLVTTSHSDADNVFIIVSARNLNPDIVTLATALSSETAAKLELVGADRVVSSAVATGQMLAWAARAPLAVELFLGSIAAGEFEECTIEEDSPLVGSTIREFTEDGVMVMAYCHQGRTETNPDPDTAVKPDMTLLLHGQPEEVARFRTRAGGSR